ncbi:MAG: rhodanese-like domain-containing protein [Nitrospinota bacterium]|nr:rhodanese-like domain-containing protein [Nitrospinota bacterium]
MKHDSTSLNRILSRKIKAHLLRVSILFFGLIGPLQPAFPSPDFAPLITVKNLQNLPGSQVVLIDARSSWKFLAGHIPGAINLNDWEEFTIRAGGIPGQINRDKDFIAHKLRVLGADYQKAIVIYGDPEDKWRTDGRFFWMFEFYGFKRVALLKGGLQEWEKTGMSVERGFGNDPKPALLKASDIKFNEDILADQNWILRRLKSDDIVVIDNREQHEYDGATPYGSSRGGHIPGAIHIDWREFFEANGNLKPIKSMDSILSSKGIRPNQEIVVYCTGGVRSAMAFFVFRYLGFKVRNYDGSWWDWSHNPKLPIES